MEAVAQDIARLYGILQAKEERLRNCNGNPPPELEGLELAEWTMATEDRIYEQCEGLGFTIDGFNDFFNGACAKATESCYLGESFPKTELMAEICGVPLRVIVGKDRDSTCMRKALIASLQN